MITRVRSTIALLVILFLIICATVSARRKDFIGRGERQARSARVTNADVRRLLLTRARDALAAGDAGRAWTGWSEAYRSARASGSWRALIDVGDAAVGMRAVPRARESYAAALQLARRERSVEGVLRAGGAFAGVGDQRLLEEALRTARQIAGRDPALRGRVREFAAVFGADATGAASPDTAVEVCP
jgi:hypothetical protein